jgi:type IV secretion system protein VirB10
MTTDRHQTGATPEAAPIQVEKEIPSAVAATSTANKTFLLVFLAALAIVGYFVLAGKDEKPAKQAAPFESAAGINVPADLQEKMEKMDAMMKGLPAPGSNSRPGGRPVENAGDALEDARRHAPAVVYNQRSNAGATTAAAPVPNNSKGGGASVTTTSSPTGGGVIAVASADAGTGSSVAYSSAPSATATIMGNRDHMIGQGKLIDGVLETALNSDQPGMVRALVNVDIYGDSGRRVLLPRGTRIVGRYDSGVVKGQTRVFIVWQRVMRPDGVDLAIESPGADELGRAGMSGDVDNHFWRMFGAATLLSVVGTGSATVGVSPTQDQNNSVASFRQGVADSFTRNAGSVLDRYIDIKPTIKVDQGQMIKIFVSKDLIFNSSLQFGSVPQVIR